MTCQISNVRGNHINLSFVEKVCGYEEINCVMPFPRMRKDIYDNIQRFKFSLPSFCANCSSFQPLNYISNSLCRLGIVSELRSTNETSTYYITFCNQLRSKTAIQICLSKGCAKKKS